MKQYKTYTTIKHIDKTNIFKYKFVTYCVLNKFC